MGGMLPYYWGDTSLYGFAPMVMKRFEIIEKLYLSKALLKMAGGGDASPTSPLNPPLMASVMPLAHMIHSIFLLMSPLRFVQNT